MAMTRSAGSGCIGDGRKADFTAIALSTGTNWKWGKALTFREPVARLNYVPFLNSLRFEPRYQELLSRLNLPRE